MNPIFDTLPTRAEENVRGPIRTFLRQFVRQEEIEGEYSVPGGRVDLFLPKARLVIETKAPKTRLLPERAGPKESPLDQLRRYVAALQQTERQGDMLNGGTAAPWVGTLTNGSDWYAYEWENGSGLPRPIPEVQGRKYSDYIDGFLRKTALREAAKPWIPENPAPVFDSLRKQFLHMSEQAAGMKSQRTQRTIWGDLIRGSGLPVRKGREEALFDHHVVLLAISRAVAGLFQNEPPIPERLLDDSYGSWIADSQAGRVWLRDLCERVDGYNWQGRPVDVLRRLYHSIIPKDDRKLYGEYYTPDWLAEMICEKLLDEEWLGKAIRAADREEGPPAGIGVLDPTCGSGTFLYHAARRIASAVDRHLPNSRQEERSEIAAKLVSGIDIHPVAVEMARATLARALPRLGAGKEPAIYQGDALLVPREDENSLIPVASKDEALFVYPPGSHKHEFLLPFKLFDADGITARLQKLVDSARRGTALPKPVLSGLSGPIAKAVAKAHKSLTAIISEHGDGIWTWYIRNQLAPQSIRRRKVDRIVSNPPWLRFSEIQEKGRKDEARKMALEYGLWPGGHTNTGFDIAGLFVARTKSLYLTKKGSRAAYVLNAAALKSKQWKNFRNHKRGYADGALDMSKDHGDGQRLSETPFPKQADSCVVGLTGEKRAKRLVLSGKDRVSTGMKWAEVKPLVREIDSEATPPWKPSHYLDRARQGATVVPAVLVRADPANPNRTLQPTRAKPPWKHLDPFDISAIPAAWRHEYLEAHNVVPFGIVRPLSQMILAPSAEEGNDNPTWRKLEAEYSLLRGKGKTTPKSLVDRIEHGGAWKSQFPLQPSVIYNASGQVLRAAVAALSIEHKLYRIPLNDDRAAHYLCAMLNAKSLRALYVRARNSGRDFDKTPLARVPIPEFNPKNTAHCDLAGHSLWLHENGPDTGNPDKREAALAEIDILAKKIILAEDESFSPFFQKGSK